MMNCLKIRVCHFDDRREEKSFQQLGRKRPRLFPQLISPARETRANGNQRGALHCSPLDSPAPLSPLQAAEISYFKRKFPGLGFNFGQRVLSSEFGALAQSRGSLQHRSLTVLQQLRAKM